MSSNSSEHVNKRWLSECAITATTTTLHECQTNLTKLICVPIERCLPEQSKHSKMPYVADAHVGFLALQSKHV